MANNKTIIRDKLISRIFQLLLNEKFTECTATKTKEGGTLLHFKTPYVGHHNWLKINIPIDLVKSSGIEVDYQLDGRVDFISGLSVYTFWELIPKLDYQYKLGILSFESDEK